MMAALFSWITTQYTGEHSPDNCSLSVSGSLFSSVQKSKGFKRLKQIPFMLLENYVTPQSSNMPLQRQMTCKWDGIHRDFLSFKVCRADTMKVIITVVILHNLQMQLVWIISFHYIMSVSGGGGGGCQWACVPSNRTFIWDIWGLHPQNH